MARPKSVLKKLEVDVALKSHNCQHNSHHRINLGSKRLKVTVERTSEHFCIECALKIIDSDISKLNALRKELTNSL